jgi:hypothetical protein
VVPVRQRVLHDRRQYPPVDRRCDSTTVSSNSPRSRAVSVREDRSRDEVAALTSRGFRPRSPGVPFLVRSALATNPAAYQDPQMQMKPPEPVHLPRAVQVEPAGVGAAEGEAHHSRAAGHWARVRRRSARRSARSWSATAQRSARSWTSCCYRSRLRSPGHGGRPRRRGGELEIHGLCGAGDERPAALRHGRVPDGRAGHDRSARLTLVAGSVSSRVDRDSRYRPRAHSRRTRTGQARLHHPLRRGTTSTSPPAAQEWRVRPLLDDGMARPASTEHVRPTAQVRTALPVSRPSELPGGRQRVHRLTVRPARP